MPKIVNHDERRRQLGEAVWRVIRREGLEGVSVRSVAREAGISLGALRYYFSNQSDLLAFSMRMVSQRIQERLEQLVLSGDLRTDLETVIQETLPMDESRWQEALIWLVFISRSLTDRRLSDLAAEAHQALAELFGKLALALHRAGYLPESDIALEASRLHALVDGLALHALLSPQSVTPEVIRHIVARHLESLMHRSAPQ